tara:strand:- start:633 stop:887 length:255 start_codon:yes stop_codon:yes gene_type:complete
MPFQLVHYKKGHDKMEYPHYMLRNINTGVMVKKAFRSKEGAIGFAKNAIRFREKKQSKVIGKGDNVKILPITVTKKEVKRRASY